MCAFKADFCGVCVCVCVWRGEWLCNLVGVYFTDTVNSANKSQMNYNNSSRDLVVTKKV